MLLSAYSYDVQFKRTDAHSNADGLSRLPLPEVTSERDKVWMLQYATWLRLPVTTVQIRQAIQKDVVLSKVYAAWMA